MGIQITIPNTNFTKFFDMTKYPINDQLSALFYLGGSKSASTKNHAREDAPGVALGDVTYHTGYALFGPNAMTDKIRTSEVDDTNDLTVISVYRKPNAFSVGRSLFSTGNLGSLLGGQLIVRDTSTTISNDMAFIQQVSGTGGNTQLFFSFSVSVVKDSELTTYYFNGADIIAKGTKSLTRTRKEGKNIVIGGDNASMSFNDPIEISMIAYHKKALTLDEIKLVYSYLTSYYAKKGVDFR